MCPKVTHHWLLSPVVFLSWEIDGLKFLSCTGLVPDSCRSNLSNPCGSRENAGGSPEQAWSH